MLRCHICIFSLFPDPYLCKRKICHWIQACEILSSDKYLALSPVGAIIEREYRVVHPRRYPLSKFQPNRIRSFVLTTYRSGCVYDLFPNFKKSFAEQEFDSNEEVIAATETYFADLEKTYSSDELKKVKYRWVWCIELRGDFWEINLKRIIIM